MEVVHTKNAQEWYDVQRFMVNRNKIWAGGERILSYISREHHGVNACIIISDSSMTFGSMYYHKKEGYTVISFKEFMKRIKENHYG